MEVVGLTAAAISIAKTLQTLARLIKQLYRAARDSPSVGAHMRHFAANFRNSSQTVKLAIQTLATNCLDHPGSPVVKHITAMNHLQCLAEESAYLMVLVRNLRDEIPKIKSRFDFLTSFRWTRLKPELEALFAPTTSLMATLNLTANLVTLGHCSAQDRTPHFEKEIQRLKNEITEQMETIRQLREEIQYIPPMVRRNTNESQRTVDSQVTLCHLAHSMVETERVPSSPPETFTFTKLKRKRHSRTSSGASTRSETPKHQRPRVDSPVADPLRHPPSPPAPVPRTTTRSSPPRDRDRSFSDDQGHMVVFRSPREEPRAATKQQGPLAEVERNLPEDIPPTPNPPEDDAESEPLGQMTSTSTSTPSPTAEPEAENARPPSPKPRRQYTNRTAEIIQDRTDLHHTTVTSWVPSKSGEQEVEAFIDRRLKQNLISQHLQEQLGLEVEEHRGQVVGQYDGKAWSSLGVATLRWGSNRVECRCYVIRELERPLFFGRMFPFSDSEGS